MPAISMSPSAHYTTQQGVWSTAYTGPLTNRRINAYKKRGYFASGLKPCSQKVRLKKSAAKKPTLKKLAIDYIDI